MFRSMDHHQAISTKLRRMCNTVQNSIALHLFLICVYILVLEQAFEIAANIRNPIVTRCTT
jgi:hypothetical protein